MVFLLKTERSLGCEVVFDADQEDGNDLDKCIKHIHRQEPETCMKCNIIILGACGGRFDQEAASFHALYRWSECFHNIVLLTDCSVTFLLQPNLLHRIRCNTVRNGPTCGLIPLAGPVNHITTTRTGVESVK